MNIYPKELKESFYTHNHIVGLVAKKVEATQTVMGG